MIISATKTDSTPAATKVLPNSTVTYTNTISNTGAASATGVTFTDPDVVGSAGQKRRTWRFARRSIGG